MNPLALALWGWLLMAIIQLALYCYQSARRDATIVDVGWALGVGILALIYAAAGGGDPARRLVLAVLAGFWSGRLASHLFVNRVAKGVEDERYADLRKRWGGRAPLYFFFFFQIQAAWSVLFSVPFLVVAFNGKPALSGWTVAAGIAWLTAVIGESTADRQLARFRSDPSNRGKACRAGLWRYSRHPNYFFEWIHWWTYVLLAAGSPYWFVALWGPAIMLLFLLKITGIPPTEAKAVEALGDEYREYQRTTSAFVPWFPAKEKR